MRARYFISVFFIFLVTVAFAKEIPPKPNPPRLVNDFAGMLSSSERDALENKLVAYNDSTSTQIAIVTERSLDGDDVFNYSYRLAEAWGIGNKGKNNGILIYVALEDHKIYIQTGYGTEGFLPDAIAKRIIENIIKPAFRNEQYYEGLDRATSAIISYAAGEYKADDKDGKPGGVALGLIILALIVGFFLFILIAAIRSKKHNDDDDDDGGFWHGGRYDEGRTRNRGGGWIIFPPTGGGGWNSGGGGGWSGGGGGFGGFGGGGFGGGGAGGSW